MGNTGFQFDPRQQYQQSDRGNLNRHAERTGQRVGEGLAEARLPERPRAPRIERVGDEPAEKECQGKTEQPYLHQPRSLE